MRKVDMLFLTFFFVFLFLCPGKLAWSEGYDPSGILSTTSPRVTDSGLEKMRPAVQEFVQQVVINTLIEETGKMINLTLQQINMGLLPDLAYFASQQAALQAFKQPQTLDIIRSTYDECVTFAMDELGKGSAQAAIQEGTRQMAEQKLQPLLNHDVFRQVIRKVIEFGLQNQQRIIAQKTMQQSIQQMFSQQKQVQKEIVQEYEKNVNSILVH